MAVFGAVIYLVTRVPKRSEFMFMYIYNSGSVYGLLSYTRTADFITFRTEALPVWICKLSGTRGSSAHA
jgi:hypothetical protein